MRIPGLLVALLAVVFAMQVKAEPMLLSLNAEQLRDLELDSIPPWPDGIVLSGTNQHWQKVLHRGDFVVVVYEAMPALIDVSAPYPYDEYVEVLEGEVTLTSLDGDKQTYGVGDSFTVPKGWMGTWHMPVRFRELIVVETQAWVASGE